MKSVYKRHMTSWNISGSEGGGEGDEEGGVVRWELR